jgi:general secretion pathway protein A
VASTAPPESDTVAARLAAASEDGSARAALEALLGAWHADPLGADETAGHATFAQAAGRRGLEYTALAGSVRLLRLLDLPVVLELHLPGAAGPRYAALMTLDDTGALLAADGRPAEVDRAFLDLFWLGQAHVLWRDFEALGRTTIEPASAGPGVRKLQQLLRRAGAYAGPETGVFDDATTEAVLGFQRDRFLVTDARVGRLTRLMLYAAAGGYRRPSLGAGPQGTS